jgi:hypothetical protein
MMSDLPKKPKKPSDIADQLRELQQLRKQVHETELELSRNRTPRADIHSKVDGKDIDCLWLIVRNQRQH